MTTTTVTEKIITTNDSSRSGKTTVEGAEKVISKSTVVNGGSLTGGGGGLSLSSGPTAAANHGSPGQTAKQPAPSVVAKRGPGSVLQAADYLAHLADGTDEVAALAFLGGVTIPFEAGLVPTSFFLHEGASLAYGLNALLTDDGDEQAESLRMQASHTLQAGAVAATVGLATLGEQGQGLLKRPVEAPPGNEPQVACLGGSRGGSAGTCFVAGTTIAAGTGAPRLVEALIPGRKVDNTGNVNEATAARAETWRMLRAHMDDHGDRIDLLLLRPLTWIAENRAEAGGNVEIAINELNVQGPMKVEEVVPVPELEGGPGRVVLGVSTHLSNDVHELLFVEGGQPLRPTGAHLLFSLDRGDWVATRELRRGERLSTKAGAVTVAEVRKTPGVQRVYNLEVETDHAYFAGNQEVLSHNEGACPGDGLPTRRQAMGKRSPPGRPPRHEWTRTSCSPRWPPCSRNQCQGRIHRDPLPNPPMNRLCYLLTAITSECPAGPFVATLVLQHPDGRVGFDSGPGDMVLTALLGSERPLVVIEAANSPRRMTLQAEAISSKSLHSSFRRVLTCSAPSQDLLGELDSVAANLDQQKKNQILKRNGRPALEGRPTKFDAWISVDQPTPAAVDWLLGCSAMVVQWCFSEWGLYARMFCREEGTALGQLTRTSSLVPNLELRRVANSRDVPAW